MLVFICDFLFQFLALFFLLLLFLYFLLYFLRFNLFIPLLSSWRLLSGFLSAFLFIFKHLEYVLVVDDGMAELLLPFLVFQKVFDPIPEQRNA